MPEKKLTLPVGTKVPDHIAIIPDGNRRWARSNGLSPSEGHKAGADRTIEIARVARDWGIHTVTFWGLSTENWRERSTKEVAALVQIISNLIDTQLKEAKKDGVRMIHLGRKDRLPRILLNKLRKAEKETRDNTKFVFNIALDYGGHDELIRAVQAIIKDDVEPKELDKKLFEKYLDTHDQPYPYVDLLIRTSGEQRTSGLLLWQMDYAELYWERDHLPDLTPAKLREAILDYSRRRRRFGGDDAEDHFQFKPEMAANLEVNWWRLAKIPEGTRFRDYVAAHIAEQWGLSTQLAGDATKHFVAAMLNGNVKDWKRATKAMQEFYKLIRDEVKLAFEPRLVASLDIKLWQKEGENLGELETDTRQLVSEVYRISDLQASKAAHLRSLATLERKRAERGEGEIHWAKAEEYLTAYYKALKDRVA